MRFWDITLFLIIINVFGAFLTAPGGLIPSLGFTEGVLIDPTNANNIATEFENEYNTGLTQEEITNADPVTQALGLIYEAVKKVWDGILGAINQYIFWLPYLMTRFGVPPEFAYGFQVLLLSIQTIGFAQLITGRSIKAVE